MNNFLVKSLAVICIATVALTGPLSSISAASPAGATSAYESISTEYSMQKVFPKNNENDVYEIKTAYAEVNIEVIDGVIDDWTKIKVSSELDGSNDIVEKTTVDGKDSFSISTDEGKVYKVTTDGTTVYLNGKALNSNSTVSPVSEQNSVVSPMAWSGVWIYESYIQGDVNTDYSIISVLAAILSALYNVPYAGVVSLATGIIALAIKNVWYTKITYHDGKAYQRMHRTVTFNYSDSLRYNLIGETEFII